MLQILLVSDTLLDTDGTIYKWNIAFCSGEGDSLSVCLCFIGTLKFSYCIFLYVTGLGSITTAENCTSKTGFVLGLVVELTYQKAIPVSRLICGRSPFCRLALCQDPD